MALYEVEAGKLSKIAMTTLIGEGVKERQELQRWLIAEPSALGEKLFIITEEYGEWEDSRRRIDLLALDEDKNLVVIELKRTEDGGHMDLQAIRYAAMVSSMLFEDVVRTHEQFLARQGIKESARTRLEAFLNAAPNDTIEISNVPRILLVAQDFSLEITTTVLWLVERGLDITCIKVVPYRVGDRRLLDFHQVLPLKEASEYQVRIRKKDETIRRTTGGEQRERTLVALSRCGIIAEGTEIEIVPKALPTDAAKRDPRTFRATIGDIESRDSIVWALDGSAYSASRLSHKLRDEYGLSWIANNIFMHWRVVGETQSMWDRAEALTRNERFVVSGKLDK